MSGYQVHRWSTLVLSLLMAIVGIALVVQALIVSDVLSVRPLLGLLLVGAGVGRVYVEVRRGSHT